MFINKYIKNIKLFNEIWITDKKIKVSYPEEGSSVFKEIEEHSYWFKHRNQCILHIINNHPAKEKLLFDIGGGNGYVGFAIQKANHTPIIIEPSIVGIMNAKSRGFKYLVNADFQSLHIDGGSIPAISLFDVLEHIKEEELVLGSIYKSLQEKGKLYLTVPAFNFLWSNEDMRDGHFRRYTRKDIEKVLNSAGFKIVYSSYFFMLLPIPIFFFRKIPSLFSKKTKEIKGERVNHSTGFFEPIFSLLFKIESYTIRKNKRIPWGSSLIVVAEK